MYSTEPTNHKKNMNSSENPDQKILVKDNLIRIRHLTENLHYIPLLFLFQENHQDVLVLPNRKKKKKEGSISFPFP